MELIENADIKETSKTTHIKKIKFLNKLIDNLSLKKFKNVDLVMEALDKQYPNSSSKKGYVATILTVLREADDEETRKKYNEVIKKVNKDVIKKIGKNKLNDTEKEKVVKWEDIKKIKPRTLDDKIFYQFITGENLFLRLKIFDIKLKNYNTEKDNYIKDGKLIMNDFKNVKAVNKGRQEFKLNKKTLNLIGELDTEYLLSYSDGGDFIRRFFNKYLGKKVNDRLLRKIWINYNLNKGYSNNTLKKKAERMLNNLSDWNNDYRKTELI